LENKGIWRIHEFGEYTNLENKGEIVEFAESKTRSEEGILRSLRTSVQKLTRVISDQPPDSVPVAG
jgi:hypothetical protein